MSNKNILFIAYYFPPIKAIGGIRSYNFAKYLCENNWNIDLITTSAHKVLPNDNFFSKLIKVKYIYITTLDIQVLRKIFNFKKKERKALKISTTVSETSFMQKIRNSFPLNISYEGGFIYIFCAIIVSIYKIKKNKINYVYSTYSPNANHIIAYILKRVYPNIIWIADFRDLAYGDSESNIFFKKFQLRMNKTIYSKANVLITVSEGIKEVLLKYNENIHVINNGIDIDISSLQKSNKIDTDSFNIVYTGSLYGGKRDCNLLFKTVKKLIDDNQITNQIKLVYAGNDGVIWEYFAQKYKLEKYIENHGLLSKDKVSLLQRKASLLLMLTWSTKHERGILTGKFYEYLEYIKPIICLINGDKDSEIEYKFDSLNCGIVLYNDDEVKLNEYINYYFQQWKIKGSIEMKYEYKELEKYTSIYLTKKLESILIGPK